MLLICKQLRLQRGLSLRAVAKAVRVAPATLANVESGRARPWPALRRRLSKFYRVPERQLFADLDSAFDHLQDFAGGRP